jgi:hypothetical protein
MRRDNFGAESRVSWIRNSRNIEANDAIVSGHIHLPLYSKCTFEGMPIKKAFPELEMEIRERPGCIKLKILE